MNLTKSSQTDFHLKQATYLTWPCEVLVHGASDKSHLRLDKHNGIQVQLQNSELKNNIVLSHHKTSAEGFCAGFGANKNLQWGGRKGLGGYQGNLQSVLWATDDPEHCHHLCMTKCSHFVTLWKRQQNTGEATLHAHNATKSYAIALAVKVSFAVHLGRVDAQHSQHETPLINSTLTSYTLRQLSRLAHMARFKVNIMRLLSNKRRPVKLWRLNKAQEFT